MIFEQEKGIERFGKILGFLFGYFLFTTVMYFVLAYSGKLPDAWGYFGIVGITAVVFMAGSIARRLLK
jgi:ABC-type Na+ efflux pump permease subunit